MEQLLSRIRDGLSRGAYPNERAVSTSIVVPILRALGWDDSDPEQVLPEHSSGRGRVDYALRVPPRPPIAFIEVKGVGRSLDADRQLFEYAFHEGVPLAVLTDGREWSFYLPAEQGSYDERRVYQLVLDERDIAESIERLRRYLQRDHLASGASIESARYDYRDARSRREAFRTLPRAWSELLAEPDGLLTDLILERTEALCGFRPGQVAAEAFLRGQSGGDIPTAPQNVRTATLRVRAAPAFEPSADAPLIQGRSTWRVRTQSGNARNGFDAFACFIESVFAQFPDRTDHILAAARTRSRANIARSPEVVYPDRPDLGRASRKMSNGLYLGKNLSSIEKQRLARQVCGAVGLTMGLDAQMEL